MRYYKLPKRLFFTMDPISSSFLTNCLYIFLCGTRFFCTIFCLLFVFGIFWNKERKKKNGYCWNKGRYGLIAMMLEKMYRIELLFVLHLQYILYVDMIIPGTFYCPKKVGREKGKLRGKSGKIAKGKHGYLFMST